VRNLIPNPVPLNATPMANALLYRICAFSMKPQTDGNNATYLFEH
jgi:hypothetical protein